ncbi:MAG: hypothetical protein IJ041_02250 [Clostridia bacterium]|nr:hypothetical protein [Clostridia bacterium]
MVKIKEGQKAIQEVYISFDYKSILVFSRFFTIFCSCGIGRQNRPSRINVGQAINRPITGPASRRPTISRHCLTLPPVKGIIISCALPPDPFARPAAN